MRRFWLALYLLEMGFDVLSNPETKSVHVWVLREQESVNGNGNVQYRWVLR